MFNLTFLIFFIYYPYIFFFFFFEKFFFFFFNKFFLNFYHIFFYSFCIFLIFSCKKNIIKTKNILILFFILFLKCKNYKIFLITFNYNYNILNTIIFSHTFCVFLFIYVFWCNYYCSVFSFSKNQQNDYSKYFYLGLTALFLGSIWSSQEVLWGGYWNWDLVEKCILYYTLIYCLVNHFFKKKELLHVILNSQFLFLFFFFFFSTKTEFSNSIHAFTNNNISVICYLLMFFIITNFYVFYKNLFFKKNVLFLLLNSIYIMYYLNSLFVFINFNYFNIFKFLFIFFFVFQFIKKFNNPFLILFELKIFMFFTFKFFFFKKKSNSLFYHFFFFLILYFYFLLFLSPIFNKNISIKYIYDFFHNIKVNNNFLKINSSGYYWNVNFVVFNESLIVKFFLLLYNDFIFFYIFYTNKLNVVYFIYIPLNLMFIFFFFLKIKNSGKIKFKKHK